MFGKKREIFGFDCLAMGPIGGHAAHVTVVFVTIVNSIARIAVFGRHRQIVGGPLSDERVITKHTSQVDNFSILAGGRLFGARVLHGQEGKVRVQSQLFREKKRLRR